MITHQNVSSLATPLIELSTILIETNKFPVATSVISLFCYLKDITVLETVL